MSCRNHKILFVCLLSLSGLLITGSPAAGQNPSDHLQRIFADWQSRQQRIKRARYIVTGQSIVPKGSRGDDSTGMPLAPANPTKDIPQEQSFKLLLDLENKRFSMDMTAQLYFTEKSQLFTRVSTTIFDGKDVWTEMPREANTNTVVQRGPTDW